MTDIELEKINRNKGEIKEKEETPVKVLGFRVAHTGYFVAIPRALHLTFKIISGIASDKIRERYFGPRKQRCASSTLLPSRSLPHQFFFTNTRLKCCKKIWGLFRQHSHFVLSQIQFIKCLSLFIEPLLIFLICTNNTLVEWRIVFLIHGILLIGGNIVFFFFFYYLFILGLLIEKLFVSDNILIFRLTAAEEE
uniref:Transmembrane protein n=1 Tax=Heterorhabditis bacteriophora TaxID=37862 RepID=A0A1I7WY06_HETBA